MPGQNRCSPEALYAQYRMNMFYRAMEYTQNREDAEDVVSEAWLSLLSHFHKLPDMDEKARSAYIMRCVQNTAIDHLRKNKKIKSAESRQAEAYPPENTPPHEKSLEEMLSRLLDALPRRERQAIELRIRGYDDNAIARALGIAPATVRVCMHHARRRMRAALKARDNDSP